MSKPQYASTTGPAVIYDMAQELTELEIRKLLELGRAIKRGQKDKGLIEKAFGKKNELYIVGLSKA